MAAKTNQSFVKPVVLAIAEGATTPVPSAANAVVLSSDTGMYMRWADTQWTAVTASYATTAKWGVD